MWTEDERLAESVDGGVVRFVRNSRAPATFVVEGGSGPIHDRSTVRIRLAVPATGWLAFGDDRLGIKRRPETFQLNLILP
jgi:hypothetical protein